jgi:hypothetical protein
MSRFQAQTNAILDQELEDLRRALGLERSQRAELLREVAALAAWVLRQTEAGRTIEARRGAEVEPLAHPALTRLRARRGPATDAAVLLSDPETKRLAEVLDRGFVPTPALRTVLRRLAAAKRRPPKLRWRKTAA